ncbi:MAG: YceI family protein [Bacteroidota bacterium]
MDAGHTSVKFSVKHIIAKTSGVIGVDSGYIDLNADTKIFVVLNPASINTQNSVRDGHLKDKEEFFNVAKYKSIVLSIHQIEKDTTNSGYAYIGKGNLTLKDVTKDISVAFNIINKDTVEMQGQKLVVIGFEGKTSINRLGFNIGPNLSIGEIVDIEFSGEAFQPLK